MNAQPARVRVLKTAIFLAVFFDLFALLVLLRHTPIFFTVFMFVGQPLFVVALILLLGAVLAELKSRELF